MLRAIAPRHVFAGIEEAGAAVAAGLGVCERGWVGAFDMIVAADHRRRAHLQVGWENAPAIALEERLGFRSLSPDWYRIRSRPA